MGAPVMDGEDLDIFVAIAAVLLVLNAKVRNVHAVVEVRQVVLPRPLLDLPRLAIGPPITVRAVPVVLQQYPSVALADVYSVIAYYLRHESDIQAYLSQRHEQAAQVRQQNERRFDPAGVRYRLLARRR